MGDMKMWFLELMKLAFDGFWGLLNTQICCQISNPLSSPWKPWVSNNACTEGSSLCVFFLHFCGPARDSRSEGCWHLNVYFYAFMLNPSSCLCLKSFKCTPNKCEWKGLKFQSSLAMPKICILYWWSLDVMRCISNSLPSLKLTWHLKMDGWKTRFLLGWPIFRCELLVSGSVCVIMDK